MLKQEDQLTKMHHVHATIDTTASTTTSIATTCKVKSIKMKISRSM